MRLSYFLLSVTLVAALFQLPVLQEYVIWNSDQITQGQWWRIVTGNLTHTNTIHLAMNLAALWVISYIFRPGSLTLFYLLTGISAVVGAGLIFSDMQVYAGLSGVLHGLFACFALNEALGGRRSSWLLVAGVIAKVGWEQAFGASPETAELIAAEVAVEAHLAGCISGLAVSLTQYSLLRRKSLSAD